MVGPPVHFPGDVDVIHETLDVEGQVGGVGAHQPLELLALLVEADQSPGLGAHVQLVPLGKLLAEMLDYHLVKVLTAQLRVTGCSENLRSHHRTDKLMSSKGNANFVCVASTHS